MDKKEVILITGSSRSIGRYLVEYFAKKGFQVIGCSRSPVDYEFENYKHFCLDVSDETKVKQMFSEVRKTYNRLDILINNAGIMSANYALLTPLQTVKNILDANFIGTFLFCREAVKLMQKNQYGRIINISSIAVQLVLAGSSIYSASKAAVEQFSKVLAKEVAPYNITVNILGLSLVGNSGMAKDMSERAIKQTLEHTASKSQLDFDDIIHAVDFFISPKSSTVTGQILHLSGL